MKWFHLIFCILFLFFAALQYNDPDPWLWIPVYLYGALVCWWGFRGKFLPAVSMGAVLLYAVYAVYLFFAADGVWEWMTRHRAENLVQTMQATKPWIEETREFLGLVILIAVLLVNFRYGLRRKRHGYRHPGGNH